MISFIISLTVPVIRAAPLIQNLSNEHPALVKSMRSVAYEPPKSFLTGWLQTQDLGEPMNVIVSAKSSPEVLTYEGFGLYLNSLNVSQPCLGQAKGINGGDNQQCASLDGSECQPELLTWRDDFGNPLYGSCLQTFKGGFHLRAFNQTSTGAIFIAASNEEDLVNHHTISTDGYDAGRDEFLKRAIGNGNGSHIETPIKSRSYAVTIEREQLLAAAAAEINHGIASDGKVAVMTIHIVNAVDSMGLALKAPGRLGSSIPLILLAWLLFQ